MQVWTSGAGLLSGPHLEPPLRNSLYLAVAHPGIDRQGEKLWSGDCALSGDAGAELFAKGYGSEAHK